MNTYLSDPQLHQILTTEHADRLRTDGVRAWTRRRPRRRFAFALTPPRERVVCDAQPRPTS